MKEFFGLCVSHEQRLVFVQGPPLLDALSALGGRYSEEDVKVLMGRLLDAVAFMHLNDVTHRDLKLENLVLARPGDLSSVTIIDFGLAKAVREGR